MIQAGGINNPARSMGVSINGQPPNNTLFRIDGAAVTNQWYPDIQSYSPSLEAVETVSVVTNSFDADQGMAGGAAVNVQVKSGTNTISGSLFEYVTASGLKNRPFFLPANADKGADNKNTSAARSAGRSCGTSCFFFVSVESEVRRVKNGTVQLAGGERSTGTTGLNSLPPADLRAAAISHVDGGDLRPADRRRKRNGAGAVRIRELPGTDLDDRSEICVVQLHPGQSHQPDFQGPAERPRAADRVWLYRQLLRSRQLRIDAQQDRYEDDMDPGKQAQPEQPAQLAGEPPEQPRDLSVADGEEFNPLSVGRLWQANITSGSVLATSILSQTFVVDGVFGYTPYHSWVGPEGPEDECWGNHYGSSTPASHRDHAIARRPMFNMGWSMVTPSQMRDYADNQIVTSANAGWTKGTHNVKFGFDVQKNYLNHYETAVPVFTFNGGTPRSAAARAEYLQSVRRFPAGTAAFAKRTGDDAAPRH